jgi:DNA invertase Pin-like site-specific DNA recombinase
MANNKTLRAVGYYRVSLLLGQSCEHQRVPFQEFVKYKGYTLVGEYEDTGVSGAKDNRPGLNQLLADARKGKFDVVIVGALDRLARDARMLLNIVHDWEGSGVYLISLRENINFADDLGKTFLAILGAIGSLERATIRERIKTAMAVKKLVAHQAGLVWKCGRPRALDENTLRVVQGLHKAGLSIRKIRTQIGGKAGVATIQSAIKNMANAQQ